MKKETTKELEDEILEEFTRKYVLKVKKKDTHFCPYNDGEQNCECYLQALTDLLTHIDNEIKKIEG